MIQGWIVLSIVLARALIRFTFLLSMVNFDFGRLSLK